jgi:hypothetical protein
LSPSVGSLGPKLDIVEFIAADKAVSVDIGASELDAGDVARRQANASGGGGELQVLASACRFETAAVSCTMPAAEGIGLCTKVTAAAQRPPPGHQRYSAA